MPVSYTIEIALALVLSRGWGIVTRAELVAHARTLATDPRFHPALRQLFDLRDATRGEVDRATVPLLASLSPFGQGARRAIVAPGDLAYGLSRMFEQFREPFPDEIHVCRTITEACAWLGLSHVQDWEAAAQWPPDWSIGDDRPST